MAEVEERLARIEGYLLHLTVCIDEIMPAARIAAKMLDARTSLMKRWRGGHDAK